MPICEQCKQAFPADQGLLQDSDYMCGQCVATHIAKWKQLKALGLAYASKHLIYTMARHRHNDPAVKLAA